MSISIVFIPKRPISYEEYASAIHELGGSPTPLEIGSSITSGKANVYCSFATDLSDTDYSPEEIQELTDYLGIEPRACVHVNIGHGHGSIELANEVYAHFDRRFGCIVDEFGSGPTIEGEHMI